QLHGFEERRTTDIYPADFGWTPDWLRPDDRIDWWFHNMESVTRAGVAEVTNQLLFDDEVGHQGVRALHDLAREADDRPWFLVVSFTHPHDPYVTRQRYWDLYENVEIPLPRVGADDVPSDPHSERLRRVGAMAHVHLSDDDVRRARRAYYGNISYVDEWTGRLVDTLAALGEAEDTVIVLLADHGDLLGERGLWYKMSFFEGSARIPLIVHWPQRFAPRRVPDPVSLVDLLPTFAELTGDGPGAGGPEGGPDFLDPPAGRSLVDLCAGRPSPSQREVIGEYLGEGTIAPLVMIRRGDLKYVHSPVDPDQLFDLAADPDERVNLASDPAHAGRLRELRAEVADRWDLDRLTRDVLRDQAHRRLVDAALRTGRVSPWEY
ncbi:choline-sulfatase, partial [Micrococcus sp.]|uniref:choline-sulfatase n=1 Tax=Micrococcus sp. TaxID=1271 RepID=UPI0026DDC40A